MENIDKMARDPEFVKNYETNIPAVVAMLKADADLELKTLKFISVDVNGDKAVVITEYDSKDPESGEIKHEIETDSMRKVDGKWMFYRSVVKNK